MSDHNFNPFIAQKYNLNIAVILNSFIFWTKTNAAKEKNLHEGRYWCYGTPEYFKKFFIYFTYEQIKYALEQCIKNDLLIKGNFNKKGYDRTNWYALSDKALFEYNLDVTCLKPAPNTIREISPMDSGNLPNQYHLIKPSNKTKDNNIYTQPSSFPSEGALPNGSSITNYEYQETLYPIVESKKKEPTETQVVMKKNDLTSVNPFRIPDNLIQEWIAIRNKKRAPITLTAWDRLNKTLKKIQDGGGNPVDAFEMMVEHGWSSLRAEWVIKPKDKGLDHNSTGWLKDLDKDIF